MSGDHFTMPVSNRSAGGMVSESSYLSGSNQTVVVCQKDSIMGSILQNASPYLYPFIVEYSLIAAAFLYIMWCSIGKRYSMVCEENSLSSVSCHQVPVDSLSTSSRTSSYHNLPALYSCLGSSKGLSFVLYVIRSTTWTGHWHIPSGSAGYLIKLLRQCRHSL